MRTDIGDLFDLIDTVHIKYRGLLKNAGANDVYLYYGADGWKNSQTIRMSKDSMGDFAASLPAQAAHEVNFCFKDAANNWDNNSGWNWAVNVI